MSEELTQEQRESVEAALAAGKKIEAIKIYREATGLDLKPSKEAVEQLWEQLHRERPDKFPKVSGSGCMSVVLVCVAVVAAVIGVSAVLQ